MPAERIPDRPKHKSIIFQATCKNTYAIYSASLQSCQMAISITP